jgi:hypothetical protein
MPRQRHHVAVSFEQLPNHQLHDVTDFSVLSVSSVCYGVLYYCAVSVPHTATGAADAQRV